MLEIQIILQNVLQIVDVVNDYWYVQSIRDWTYQYFVKML